MAADPNESVAVPMEVKVIVLPKYVAVGKPCQAPGKCLRSSGAEFELNDKTYCGQHIATAIRAQRTLRDYGG